MSLRSKIYEKKRENGADGQKTAFFALIIYELLIIILVEFVVLLLIIGFLRGSSCSSW